MKKELTLAWLLLFAVATFSQSIWINEIHYDNTGADQGEGIEVAGASGTDLTDYSLVLYNGNNGESYETIVLSGVIDDEENGLGALSFTPSGSIQNGGSLPDGIALVDSADIVLQFISYEGVFDAVNGPASGMTSVDIGVSETSDTPVGASLQLQGSGNKYTDFTWFADVVNTFGDINTNQSFEALSVGGKPSLNFSIQPNPTKNIVNIQSTFSISKIEIYNILGQLVKQNQNQNSIKLSTLKQGLYICKISDENGNSGVKKIVKK